MSFLKTIYDTYYSFFDSIKNGVCFGLIFVCMGAMLAEKEDEIIQKTNLFTTIILVGVFSILGLFYGVQIDALFVTALLTVIGFSVHDTIVVFDRVRENLKYYSKKMNFGEIMNMSVNQTLTRSINTSLTTLITLGALYFFGGVTTKDFVLAMILGIAIGTYSSIFFCSALIEIWEDKKK